MEAGAPGVEVDTTSANVIPGNGYRLFMNLEWSNANQNVSAVPFEVVRDFGINVYASLVYPRQGQPAPGAPGAAIVDISASTSATYPGLIGLTKFPDFNPMHVRPSTNGLHITERMHVPAEAAADVVAFS